MSLHLPADAFVFFGATGDLAYKKIFPALQALILRAVNELNPPTRIENHLEGIGGSEL